MSNSMSKNAIAAADHFWFMVAHDPYLFVTSRCGTRCLV